MIQHLKVILRKQTKRGHAKGSRYIRIGAYAVQENSEGPVEGSDLLMELSPVATIKEAKRLVYQLLETHVKEIEFIHALPKL